MNGSIERHSGNTGIYQNIADKFDVIPSDDVLAVAWGMSDAGVATARRALRLDGYEFDGFKISGMSYMFWRVTKRPVVEDEKVRAAADLLGCSYENALAISKIFINE